MFRIVVETRRNRHRIVRNRLCRFVGTVPDILGLVWPSFRPKSGSKSKISGRIPKHFRGPFRSADSGLLKMPRLGGRRFVAWFSPSLSWLPSWGLAVHGAESWLARPTGTSFLDVRAGPGIRPPDPRIASDRASFGLVSASILPLPARIWTYRRIKKGRIVKTSR